MWASQLPSLPLNLCILSWQAKTFHIQRQCSNSSWQRHRRRTVNTNSHSSTSSFDVPSVSQTLPIYLHYCTLCVQHTQPFNGPFNQSIKVFYSGLSNLNHCEVPLSGTTRVSRYWKGKTNVDFTEARDSEWQWHQLGHMQVCTSHQTENHASTPPLCFFTGRMPFLPPNQQRLMVCTAFNESVSSSHSICLTPRFLITKFQPQNFAE